MHYRVQAIDLIQSAGDCILVGVFSDQKLSPSAQRVDQISGGYLNQILLQGDLTQELGSGLLLHHVPNLHAKVFLLFCAEQSSFNEINYLQTIRSACNSLKVCNIKHLTACITELSVNDRDAYWNIRQFVEILEDVFYNFDRFKTSKKEIALKEVTILNQNQEEALSQLTLKQALAIASGVRLAKDLANLPANICTPTYMAEQATLLAQQSDQCTVDVLAREEIQQLGMGAFLAVAQGSAQPPKFVVIKYLAGDPGQQPIVLVGKGVTFDSGGISIKHAQGMEEMKFDMSGASGVIGSIHAAIALKLKVNLIGLLPLTENLPSGTATKPGDIVTSLSKQTIEIINTDAEGRLILADALTYSERFNPKWVIDMATLTGAIVVSLGEHASGLFGNDPELIHALEKAGQTSGDRVWNLPLWEQYQEQINSNIADISNIGIGGGKSITAACFLSRFTKKLRWAHLDIAGTAWKTGKDKTSTGRPVPLIVQFLLDQAT